MSTPVATAIYTRISQDIEGTGLGVARQREDCERLADSLGWTVADVYSDNDISAYSGKRRPEYERLLADLADGRIDGVIVYHLDRLTRRPIELEEFVAAVDAAKVKHVRFVVGDADIHTGDGLLVARLLSAVAASESATKSRRVKRKQQQNADAGLPHKGSTRPYGYESDHITIRPDEAEVFRQLVARFLAGESTRSLTNWLNDEGIPTVKGKPWITSTVTGMLQRPRYAGLVERNGEVVGPGSWQGIITEDEHRRLKAKYAEKRNSGRRAPRRYLLSGLVSCSRCGNRMFSAARRDSRRYVCMSGPDHRGCGKTHVVAEPLERLVADFVLYRLDTPELADALSGRHSTDQRAGELSHTVDEATEQLEELAQAYAARDISMREWIIARKPIEQRHEQAQQQLARLSGASALAGLVGNGAGLRSTWPTLSLSRQAAIVGALVDTVVIGPGSPSATKFDPHRASVVWRH